MIIAHSITKIIKDIWKSPGDLRRLAVTQTPVNPPQKKPLLKLEGKTRFLT